MDQKRVGDASLQKQVTAFLKEKANCVHQVLRQDHPQMQVGQWPATKIDTFIAQRADQIKKSRKANTCRLPKCIREIRQHAFEQSAALEALRTIQTQVQRAKPETSLQSVLESLD